MKGLVVSLFIVAGALGASASADGLVSNVAICSTSQDRDDWGTSGGDWGSSAGSVVDKWLLVKIQKIDVSATYIMRVDLAQKNPKSSGNGPWNPPIITPISVGPAQASSPGGLQTIFESQDFNLEINHAQNTSVLIENRTGTRTPVYCAF